MLDSIGVVFPVVAVSDKVGLLPTDQRLRSCWPVKFGGMGPPSKQ